MSSLFIEQLLRRTNNVPDWKGLKKKYLHLRLAKYKQRANWTLSPGRCNVSNRKLLSLGPTTQFSANSQLGFRVLP
ncbi:hypothetical protein J6590_100039 [Homalodisca vitripennis]|nr:hypothetical protein J6590_059874 [Homalodisca vitripennis]KAG8256924.1 hypothetical protein J6590_059875 [Homalodisca vitripennis]KAG8294587.1 hypothetical protein J6590_100038 [Homalodisca vitripennis]KAG8294588.1 hypothetical protein J6590_100039 [Homalodisca vitripennis]